MAREHPGRVEYRRESDRAGPTSSSRSTRPNLLDGVDPSAKRILVVDDHAQVAAMTRMALEWAGHNVEVVPHGWLALARAERFQPEVVVCDLNLPDIEGTEVAQAIRSAPWGRSMLLIACTGATAEDVERTVLAAGFDIFLAKPIDVPRLLSAVGTSGRSGVVDRSRER